MRTKACVTRFNNSRVTHCPHFLSSQDTAIQFSKSLFPHIISQLKPLTEIGQEWERTWNGQPSHYHWQSLAIHHFPRLLLSYLHKGRMRAISSLTTESATVIRWWQVQGTEWWPWKRYVHVLTLRTCKCHLIWKKWSLQIKLRILRGGHHHRL